MAPQTSQPALVYDRVAQNRRRTWILITLALAVLAPSVVAAGYLLSHLLVFSATVLWGQLGHQWTARAMGTYYQHALRFTVVTTGGISAVLGILFWAIASSPTAKLLVQAGARPPVDGECDLQHLLEGLAIGAGLPTPKLYISDSSAPNAFAAGTHPEHAALVVTTGALRLLDRRELEGVFAHELSHIGNHDIRLNTVVASIALFLRSRYLAAGTLYVGPLLADLIRASVSREREFLADADAALLTRFPRGLLRALAKIGSAGSTVAGSNPAFSHFYFADSTIGAEWFSGNLMSTHPPIRERIRRLMEVQEADTIVALQSAIRQGRQYRQTHPLSTRYTPEVDVAKDEFSALCQGNPAGRVFRVMANNPVAIHYHPNLGSEVVGFLQPGKLVVAFDDPGPFREVNTADWTFGYIPRSVELHPIPDLIPGEVYDPRSRAVAETHFPPLGAAVISVASPNRRIRLSPAQIVFAVLFGAVLFAGMFSILLKLG
jgi:heat shock protein HtpX